MADRVRLARKAIVTWVDQFDPGAHRRVKGLRIITSYAIAAMAGLLPALRDAHSASSPLSQLAAGFALWASVSEGEETRWRSTRDLAIFCSTAALGAAIMATLTPLLNGASTLR